MPASIEPYLGRFGLPDPYPRQKDPIGVGTNGIDFWQANHFVVYRKETASYLYDPMPEAIPYRKGSLPICESIAARYTAGLTAPRAKAMALLTEAMPASILHPAIPPLGPTLAADRSMDEDSLISSGKGYCNEQARVFVRLCQISGIPARMIFLFYSDRVHGHVVAEFYADGHWCMADSSWCCVFPAADEHLMSAAECHEVQGRNMMLAGQAYFRRAQKLLSLSDEALVGGQFKHIADLAERQKKVAESAGALRKEMLAQTPESLGRQLWVFGVLDYPPPP